MTRKPIGEAIRFASSPAPAGAVEVADARNKQGPPPIHGMLDFRESPVTILTVVSLDRLVFRFNPNGKYKVKRKVYA